MDEGQILALLRREAWGREKRWCIPTVNAEYVARMEDVLALYAEAPTPRRPVVCFDETPRQLIGDARVPIRAEPGKPRRVDYEYVRNGTANVFLFVDVHRPWRHAKVTDHRTCVDFAECMRDLVDEHYPEAERIQVVLDNLSTHSAAALYQTFAPAEGPTDPEAARIPLHAETRQLAQHGRDRDRGDGPAMPRSAYPGQGHACHRGRCLGAAAQCRAGGHQLVVHRRPGPHEDGPRVSAARQAREGRRVNRSEPLRRGTRPSFDAAM